MELPTTLTWKNGAYYAPDLTKAWLDPKWKDVMPMVGKNTKEEAIAEFIMHPDKYPHTVE